MLTKKETENSSNFKFTCISNILFKFILANLLKYLVTFVFVVLINYMYKLFFIYQVPTVISYYEYTDSMTPYLHKSKSNILLKPFDS